MKSCRIVSSGKNCGKSTYLEKLIKSDINPYGFLSLKEESGYSLLNIESGEKRAYLSEKPIFQDRFGKWFIDYSVFAWVFSIVEKVPSDSNVYLDEIGRLELEEKGYFNTLKYLLEKDINLILAIRSEFVPLVVDKFSIKEYQVDEVPYLKL